MATLPNGRIASTALAACLALGLGTASVAAAQSPEATSAARNGSDARPGRQARKKKQQQPARSTPRAGGTVLNGSRAPGAKLGANGDLYLRTSDDTLYGPKTRRGWGRPRSLVGPQGPQGAQGAQGTPGATGPQGLAGTPAFNAGIVTTFAAPATLTGTYDDAGELVSPDVEIGTVSVPAGVALVQLRLRVAPGDGYAVNEGATGCGISNATAGVLGAYAFSGQLATDMIGWTALAQPTTFPIRCSLLASRGTPGATVSASVAGTQVVVFGANVPGA